MANDPSVPDPVRTQYTQWGLSRDEFVDSGHWPRQLYVREGRRMVSEVVLTERHCIGRIVAEDPIGMGAYQMDSHNVRRLVHAGMVLNEGDVQVKLPRPYGISYKSIVPKRSECANLFVPVAVSASHPAFGSIRMEPVFMILAEFAATAAAHAFGANRAAVQDVDYDALSVQLLKQAQVLTVDAGVLNTTGNESLPPAAR